MENNKLEREDFEVSGRRMPLTFIRKKMLADHKKLMKLRADQEFQNMTREEIISAMDEINKFSQATSKENSVENLRNELKVFERSWHLMVQHDCSTNVGHSHFLVMVSAMYDPAVYHQEFIQCKY